MHASDSRMMKVRSEDKQIVSGVGSVGVVGVCKDTGMCDLNNSQFFKRHVMPPVQRSSLRVHHLTWC